MQAASHGRTIQRKPLTLPGDAERLKAASMAGMAGTSLSDSWISWAFPDLMEVSSEGLNEGGRPDLITPTTGS